MMEFESRMSEILQDADCRGVDNKYWFSDAPEDLAIGREVCRGCPVSDFCLLLGETTKQTREHGIFGGLDEVERARLRRSRARLIRHARERFIRDHS